MPHLHSKAHHITAFEVTPLVKDPKQPVPLRRSEDKLALLEKLNMTIELEPLLATYTAEVGRIVPISGLEFEYQDNKLQLKYSSASSCNLLRPLQLAHAELGKILYCSTTELNARQRQLIASLEQQLLQPLFNVLRFEQAKRDSMLDYLTGLGNRNYFEDAMSRMIATANRENRSFTLLFVDLDNFKAVNDNYGHLEGDRVLTEFASLLQSAIRNNDYVFRFGGDEFAILLAHSDNLHPEFVAQRVIKSTNNHTLLSTRQVTASIGYASWQPQDSCHDLIEQADAALYRVKNHGKNGYSKAG